VPQAPVYRREPADNTYGYTLVDAATPQATADLHRLDEAIHRYAKDRAGRLPSGLEALSTERSLDGDLYLSRVPTDPWGRPYVYAVINPRVGLYDLRSYGADHTPGTPDDVAAAAAPVPTH
jgi:general secretion pathway protein G